MRVSTEARNSSSWAMRIWASKIRDSSGPARLGLHLAHGDGPVLHVREVPAHDQRGGTCHAGRHTDSPEHPVHWTVSPKPVATRSASALAACSASGPSARIVIELPHSAASIITPMILFPLTPTPSLQISMSELNELASL